MANFFEGTYIEILKTDNVISRFPELVGAVGVVDQAPIHPSTWFSVKVDKGRLVKLQTTAMKLITVEKAHSQTQIKQHSSKLSAKKSVAASHLVYVDRPRTVPTLGIAHFTKGVAVKILGTDNVLQRVPHLVGMVGNIKEVAVHPITWFKIEFPSGQIATFRPSAFKLDDGKDDEVIYKAPKKVVASAVYEVKKVAQVQRDADSEFSVGMRVRIISGELSGATGEILRFGNGWIQLLTSEGKVAKRAHEIECMDILFRSADADEDSKFNCISLVNTQNIDIKRSKSGRVIRSHAQYTPTNGDNGNESRDVQQAKRPCSMPNALDLSEYPPNCPQKQKTNKLSKEYLAKSDFFDLEQQVANCPFPLISLQLREAKRNSTQSYVDRESSFNKGRPNLSYWLDQIRGVFLDKEEEVGNLVNDTSVSDIYDCYNSSDNDVSEFNVSQSEENVYPPYNTDNFAPDRKIPNKETYSRIRPRSDSLAETDCEDNMSPDLFALSGLLAQHQKDVHPNSGLPHMPTPLQLPPADVMAHNQPMPYYDQNAELYPARFFPGERNELMERKKLASQNSSVRNFTAPTNWT